MVGDGTTNNPCQIESIEDLNAVRQQLNMNYILMNNLDFCDESSYDEPHNGDIKIENLCKQEGATDGWIPIGDDSNYFTGIFDGNNKTISNLYINRSIYYVGLFGRINNSEIKNIGLINVDVLGDRYVGGLVGTASNSKIINSYVKGIIQGNRYVGGLIGEGYVESNKNGEISYSYFDGGITGFIKFVGGLVGGYYAYDGSGVILINNSYASSTINLNGNDIGLVGGFIGGFFSYNNNNINNSYSKSKINFITDCSQIYSIGGFIGEFTGGITNSSSSGEILLNIETTYENESIGGFIGYTEGGKISNSFADVLLDLKKSIKVGGFIGELNFNQQDYLYNLITNSYAKGNILIQQGENIGGFVGYSSGFEITNSYATGNINGTGMGVKIVGGFVGYNDYDPNNVKIDSSYASGNLEIAGGNVGGFVGININKIDNSYSKGNIKIYTPNIESILNVEIGGFAGLNLGDIYRSYSTGDIDINSESVINVGGFVGNNGSDSIYSSFSTGNIILNTTAYSNVGGFIGIDNLSHYNSGWVVKPGLNPIGSNSEENLAYNEDFANSFFNYSHGVYTAGQNNDVWDFENVWSNYYNGNNYPILLWQPIQEVLPITYNLIYSAGAGGIISGNTNQVVNQGGNGSSVTAIPDAGYIFVRWSDNRTENPRTDLNVSQNISVQAIFERRLVYGSGGNTIFNFSNNLINSQLSPMEKLLNELKSKIEDLKKQIDLYLKNKQEENKNLLKNFRFNKDLKFGDVDQDVKKLQIFLNNYGFKIADFGPGSPGNETTMFGFLTRAALIKFQEFYFKEILEPQKLLKGTGFFGKLSRDFVNQIINKN
ncbi:MAG: peptidoglycan-binding protein [Patescibacteria group bacterium]|nr:peptidoglycan-binding protein [Patescibacteria group bacterium]MDW8279855.1 GLUG motif-containing protein [bacterium]